MMLANRKKVNNNNIIKSFGLYVRSKSEPKWNLYLPRDNYEYIEFVRGMWFREEEIPELLYRMSPAEIQRIREYTMKELWADLWVDHTFEIYTNGYNKAKAKYDSIDKYKLNNWLNLNFSNNKYTDEWRIPKGKANTGETEIETATREWLEETKLDINKLTVLKDIKPFCENYYGSNKKPYQTHYYLAEYEDCELPLKTGTPSGIRKFTVSEEAIDVNWFTLKDAERMLNSERYSILQDAEMVLNRNKSE